MRDPDVGGQQLVGERVGSTRRGTPTGTPRPIAACPSTASERPSTVALRTWPSSSRVTELVEAAARCTSVAGGAATTKITRAHREAHAHARARRSSGPSSRTSTPLTIGTLSTDPRNPPSGVQPARSSVRRQRVAVAVVAGDHVEVPVALVDVEPVADHEVGPDLEADVPHAQALEVGRLAGQQRRRPRGSRAGGPGGCGAGTAGSARCRRCPRRGARRGRRCPGRGPSPGAPRPRSAVELP